MPIFRAPEAFIENQLKSVFLAGSIEMDKAINWQQQCEKILSNTWNVLNPRRQSWDASWEQKIENEQFRQQVEWELAGLERSDLVIMYFAKDTKSPISLLEFGLYARSGKMMVVCEDGFWRKGNVDIVCRKYKIKQFITLEELINEIQ